MTTHNNTHTDHNNDHHDGHEKTHRERPLGHLAAVVSHRTRAAIRSALADAGISRRDLRLLSVLEREPQTAEALAERRAKRQEHGHDGRPGRGYGRGRRGGHHRGRGSGHESEREHRAGHDEGGRGHRKHVHLADRLADLETRGLISTGASGILSVTELGSETRRTGRETLTALKERSTAGISEGDLETTRRTPTALAQNLATNAAGPAGTVA